MSAVAQRLRQQLTDVELRYWYLLRAKRFAEYHFRRQRPIGRYVVDFVCLKRKLIIEFVGGQHAENQEYDDARTAYLNRQGFRVLRFWNDEALKQTDAVLEQILSALNPTKPSPRPSPFQGEGVNNPLSLEGRGWSEAEGED